MTLPKMQNGWDGIQSHLEQTYGALEPLHWGTLMRYRLGGPDPLDGISAYPVTRPIPHSHFISFGMSELYEKESEFPEQSGWGYEFTMRVADADVQQPLWVCVLLQKLARYVFQSGNTLSANEHVDFQNPLSSDFETDMTALIVIEDPVLGTIDTVNGRLSFLQLFAITADEVDVVRSWQLEKFIALIQQTNPLMISNMRRPSIMSDPAMRSAVRAGIQQDGSSCGFYYFNDMAWLREGDTRTLVLSGKESAAFQGLLIGRLMHGREAQIGGAQCLITLVAAASDSDQCCLNQESDTSFVVSLTKSAIGELINLLARKGTTGSLVELPALKIRVNP